MVGSFSGNTGRPAAGSFLSNWLAKRSPHPDSFDCGIRVVSGVMDGGSARWRYQRSAVDRLILDGIVTVHHGTQQVLQLQIDATSVDLRGEAGARPGYAVLSATEQRTGAQVRVSVDPGHLERFGIEA